MFDVFFFVTASGDAHHFVSGRKRKTDYFLHLGVPALMMPAILLGSVLPFILPAIKMGAIISGLINNGALITAVMYAAKNAALSGEKPTYYNPGYHRDLSNM